MREPVIAFVGLGGNLGQAAVAVRDAVACNDSLPGTHVLKTSSLYRTAPIASTGPDYINAVAEVSTCLSAPELLSRLLAIEQAAGRERPYRHAPRTLDLDLLLYGSARIDSVQLQLPHPRMTERAFVIVPLAEIAPRLVSAKQLQAVADQHVERLNS